MDLQLSKWPQEVAVNVCGCVRACLVIKRVVSYFVLEATLHRAAGSRSYSTRNVTLSHHPTEAPACQRPRLCCQRDLFSHIGDTALLQYGCVGGSTWNAIIHYSPATEPLPAAPKYESSENHWHILLGHDRIFNFLRRTLSGEQFLEEWGVPSSMVRAVMDSLSAPWNSLKYGRTLIS